MIAFGLGSAVLFGLVSGAVAGLVFYGIDRKSRVELKERTESLAASIGEHGRGLYQLSDRVKKLESDQRFNEQHRGSVAEAVNAIQDALGTLTEPGPLADAIVDRARAAS